MRAIPPAALATLLVSLAACATPWVQPGTTYAVTVVNTAGAPCTLSYDAEDVDGPRGLGVVPAGEERTFAVHSPRTPLVTLSAACGAQPVEGAPSREVRLRGDRTVYLEVPSLAERPAPRPGSQTGAPTPR